LCNQTFTWYQEKLRYMVLIIFFYLLQSCSCCPNSPAAILGRSCTTSNNLQLALHYNSATTTSIASAAS
jgi:hypothetical protein